MSSNLPPLTDFLVYALHSGSVNPEVYSVPSSRCLPTAAPVKPSGPGSSSGGGRPGEGAGRNNHPTLTHGDLMNCLRQLCEELHNALAEYDSADPYHDHAELLRRARATLAGNPDAAPLPPNQNEDEIKRWLLNEYPIGPDWMVYPNSPGEEFKGYDLDSVPEIILQALARFGSSSPLPANYIDPEHTGAARKLLDVFYAACRSEGGTADEIHLRGLEAVLRLHRLSIESNLRFVRDPGFDQFIAELQRIQHVATREGECPSFDLVAAALGLAPQPIPVTERLPGPEDCTSWPDEPEANPWCWAAKDIDGGWEWTQLGIGHFGSNLGRMIGGTGNTHWLPWWAIPLPAADAGEAQDNG